MRRKNRFRTFQSTLWEIQKSAPLQLLGGLLGLGHVLLFWSWKNAGDLPLRYYTDKNSMCWSLVESCQWTKFLSPSTFQGLYHLFPVLGAMAAFFFFFTRATSFSWWILFWVEVLKFWITFQDYRLVSNESFFLTLITFVFLFIPNKEKGILWTFVSYLLAMGWLRLTPEWLTGIWIQEKMGWPIKLAEWFAAIIAIVQLLAPVTLLMRDGRYFWSGWTALFLSQLFLGYVDQWTTTSIVGLVLIYLAWTDLAERKKDRDYAYQAYVHPNPSSRWIVILLSVFWLAQLLQHVPIHFSLASMIRDLAGLQSVASSQVCRQPTWAVYKNKIEQVSVDAMIQTRQSGLRCHPYLRFQDLKNICHQYSQNEDFQTLQSVLDTRSLRDVHFQRVFELADVCRQDVTYREQGEQKWTIDRASSPASP